MSAANKAVEERDPVYETLFAQAVTLAEVYEREGNFISLPWLLLGSDSNSFFDSKLRSTLRALDKLASQYLQTRRISPSLFTSLAVTFYLGVTHKVEVPQTIRQAISYSLQELQSNRRLRTPELVGIILHFLSVSDYFQVSELQDYLHEEAQKALYARNYALGLDTYIGLLGRSLSIPSYFLDEAIANRKLLDNERLAKGLIMLSQLQFPAKEKFWIALKEELTEKYIVKITSILQAVINGLSLVESNLSDDEARAAYEALKHQEWTKVVEVSDGTVTINRVRPDFLRTMDTKTLGLCLLSLRKAGRTTRVSLYPEQYAALDELRKEKTYGFGIDRSQLVVFYYVSLGLMVMAGVLLIWLGGVLNG
ncbi:MAG: hypothetical protein ACRD5H_06510, partial [Nitrososphaerales archaeon]